MGLALASLAILAVQWALVSRAAIGCATPDLPLIFALYLGFRVGSELPLFRLWALGIAIDLLGPYPTGLHSLAFLGLGLSARTVADRVDPASPPIRLAALVIGTILLRAVQLGALAVEGAVPPVALSAHFVLTSGVLTALVGLPAFLVFDRIFDKGIPVLQMEACSRLQ